MWWQLSAAGKARGGSRCICRSCKNNRASARPRRGRGRTFASPREALDVPRSTLARTISSSLIATAIVCVSFAAHAVPVQPSIDTKEPAMGRDAEMSTSASMTTAAEDRAYLVSTASPGDTMMRQGPDVAIGRLNPEFVTRLASAIRDAREEGLPAAGVSSAYRPPGFGVGGFHDKFNSLHAYGLAVDMAGIGEPGSTEAKLWHKIAGRNGVICPYGADNRKEWNHCQATPVKKVAADNPLRATITAQGPVLLDEMFKVGSTVIDDLAGAIRAALTVRQAEPPPPTVRSAPVRTAAAKSERSQRGRLQQAARAGRKLATRPVVVASLDHRHVEKSRRKTSEDTKTPAPRKLGSAAADSRQGATRRRSRSA